MKYQYLVPLVTMLAVCPAALITQMMRFRDNLPRVRDRSLRATERIEAQNRLFGAIVGVSICAIGIFLTLYFFLDHILLL